MGLLPADTVILCYPGMAQPAWMAAEISPNTVS